MKHTPLYENHVSLGGKIVDFGGWALPIQYQSIIKEHLAVRNSAGLFDVSHMGEILVSGDNAQSFVQNVIANDITAIEQNQVLYTPMCYPNGGVVDDLLVYKLSASEFLLVVNAANTDKDFDWLIANSEGDVQITNVSSDYAQLALQGPNAQQILQRLTSLDLNEIKFFHFNLKVNLDGTRAIVSRTGYTGEDGFEIYLRSADAPKLWDAILDRGKDLGIAPIGLGARDTLRFEVALPLYGHELSPDITPLEARLSFFTKLNKENFIGKQALALQKQQGIKRKLIGFELIDKGVARGQMPIEHGGKQIGFVTSGSFAPSLNKSMGLGLIEKEYAEVDSEIEIVVRNRKLKAKIVKLPFYSKKYNK